MPSFDGSRSRCFYAVISGRKVVCLARSKAFAVEFHRIWRRTHPKAKLIACYPQWYSERGDNPYRRKSTRHKLGF